jgi:quercetin dioxygenase-like cupin family protein
MSEFKEVCGPWTHRKAALAKPGGGRSGFRGQDHWPFIGATSTYAQQARIERKTLLQKEGPPGYQTIVNVLEFAPGAREVRHTHPGALSGYVLEGTLTLEHEGRPTTAYKAGEAFYVDPGKIHVGMNDGAAPLKFIATLVVEKDKPASSPAP